VKSSDPATNSSAAAISRPSWSRIAGTYHVPRPRFPSARPQLPCHCLPGGR
jgi:hypothetical protein